jgi:U2 small nuclear ribonucleoprotein A'
MRLTADLARDSPAYINPLRQRELSLRGFKIVVIENLGATQDQYQVIDLSDNDILKLDNFPQMNRLEALLLANNRICRISRDVGKYLPKLDTLVLTNNKLNQFKDLKPLKFCVGLTHVVLLGNGVCKLDDYRLFVIHRLPNLKMLDFQKVKQQEREAAKAKFGDLALEEEEELNVEMGGVEIESEEVETAVTGPTPEERAEIMDKIKNATSLSEIEQLEKQLKAPTLKRMED